MELTVRPIARGEYAKLGVAICVACASSMRQCIHSWSGDSPEGVSAGLLATLSDGELAYLGAFRGQTLVAAMGAEFDEELGRAWLHGPHLFETGLESETAAAALSVLYERLMAALPGCVRQWDAYPHVDNAQAREFYEDRGFVAKAVASYEYGALAGTLAIGEDTGIGLLRRECEGAFSSLFDRLFPGTYYSAERILAMRGPRFALLALGEGKSLDGFAVAALGEGGKGEIHFIGVEPGARGRGYGRRLLRAAYAWLTLGAGADDVVLNVSGENAARSLYESEGFTLRCAGLSLRKWRDCDKSKG